MSYDKDLLFTFLEKNNINKKNNETEKFLSEYKEKNIFDINAYVTILEKNPNSIKHVNFPKLDIYSKYAKKLVLLCEKKLLDGNNIFYNYSESAAHYVLNPDSISDEEKIDSMSELLLFIQKISEIEPNSIDALSNKFFGNLLHKNFFKSLDSELYSDMVNFHIIIKTIISTYKKYDHNRNTNYPRDKSPYYYLIILIIFNFYKKHNQYGAEIIKKFFKDNVKNSDIFVTKTYTLNLVKKIIEYFEKNYQNIFRPEIITDEVIDQCMSIRSLLE